MGKSIGLLAFLTVGLLGQTSFAGVIDQPFKTILSDREQNEFQMFINRNCMGAATINTKISTIVGERFYKKCLEGKSGATRRASLFAYLDRNPNGSSRPTNIDNQEFEERVRDVLKRHGLTVNLSKEEIEIARENPEDRLFQSLEDIDFSSIRFGLARRLHNAFWFRGINLGIDLIKAYENELEKGAPVVRGVSGISEESIRLAVGFLKGELPKDEPVTTMPPSVAKWLRSVAKTSEDPNLQEACNTLLVQFGKEPKADE